MMTPAHKLYPNYRYAQEITYHPGQELFIAIDSLYGVQILSKDLKIAQDFQRYHQKRINQVLYEPEEHLLISCSNDGVTRVKDIRSKSVVKEFKKQREVYSISKSKHILCNGSEDGTITFYDLKTMKERQCFTESHTEDVTRVVFSQEMPSFLLSCSTDGMLCLFDLERDSEEDGIYTMMRMDQPLNTCDFHPSSLHTCYAATTTGLIYDIDLENSQVARQLQTVPNNEFETRYLLGYDPRLNMYTTGDYNYQKGLNVLEFYDMSEQMQYMVDVHAQGRISSVTAVREDAVVITTDDGYIQSNNLVKAKKQKTENRFKMEEEEMFEEQPETPQNKFKSRRAV